MSIKKIGAIPTASIKDMSVKAALVLASEYILALLSRIEELERRLAVLERKG